MRLTDNSGYIIKGNPCNLIIALFNNKESMVDMKPPVIGRKLYDPPCHLSLLLKRITNTPDNIHRYFTRRLYLHLRCGSGPAGRIGDLLSYEMRAQINPLTAHFLDFVSQIQLASA